MSFRPPGESKETHGPAMGYSDAAPYGAIADALSTRIVMPPEGSPCSVGAQNLEPWLDPLVTQLCRDDNTPLNPRLIRLYFYIHLCGGQF